MNKEFSAPRGTLDILPKDTPRWQEMEQKARKILNLYGYKEIRTPFYEESDLFARSLGQTSDVVQKQMLYVASLHKEEDLNSRIHLALRPEGTASVVRAYIEHSLHKQELVSKLYYIGPMFRGERPQKGRLRQFHQIGVEAMGPNTSDPYLDAEVITLSLHILNALGPKGFVVKLNSMGSMEDKENLAKCIKEKLRTKQAELCEDCKQRYLRNVFRILDCKNKECQTVVDHLSLDHSFLSPQSQIYFTKVKKALDDLKVNYQVVPKLVRGLDYYTHTVFEITHALLGSQDALGAGGRYNHLVSELGGPQVDAVGFALGLERVLLVLSETIKVALPPLEVFIVAQDQECLERAFTLAYQLRQKGLTCDLNYQLGSLKSQMRLANKSNAQFVLIIGEAERKTDQVALKDMASGQQEQIGLDRILQVLKERL